MSEIPLITPWPATADTVASRMLWLANSYAEGAQFLCDAMVADDYARKYTNTRVILHLCRHATELYFKGAVSYKTNAPPLRTHRLDRLYSEYLIHYPTERGQLELPFPRAVFRPEEGLFPDLLVDYTKTHDQRFRYPADVDGKPFHEEEMFDVIAYQQSIDRFRMSLNHMVVRIDFGWKL